MPLLFRLADAAYLPARMSCSVIEHYECVGIWLREPDLHRRLMANEPSELLLLHPAVALLCGFLLY